MIRATQPAGYGERNDSLFRLARRLKSLPAFRGVQAKHLMPIILEWYRLALPRIRTQDWRETWADFCRQWAMIRSGGESAVLANIVEFVAARTDEPLLRLELACEIIHCRRDGAPFYLACRTAGELIGRSYKQAARLLRHLVDTGILAVVQPGDRGKQKDRKATTYAYRGPSVFAISN